MRECSVKSCKRHEFDYGLCLDHLKKLRAAEAKQREKETKKSA